LEEVVTNFSAFARWAAASLVLAAGTDIMQTNAAAQTAVRSPSVTAENPPPQGRRIEANDGDTVLIREAARVQIIRRRRAFVRAIYNKEQQWLVLLVDHAREGGGARDGKVDGVYTYSRVTGEWPFEERWEAEVTLEEYAESNQSSTTSRGIGISTSAGLVQLSSAGDLGRFQSPATLAVLGYSGRGSSYYGPMSFEEAEQRAIETATRDAQANAGRPRGSNVMVSSGIVAETNLVVTPGQSSQAPVRVGGNVPTPQKIHDAAPIYPEALRPSGVTGIVILELTIGTDGTVANARVLRGIVPTLDQAAVDAARQWRYEPVLLNGTPVSAVLTATVAVRP
jgi:TonB family protein